MSLRGRLLAALASVALVAAAGQALRADAAAQGPGRVHEVRMRGNSFAPRELTVPLGDTIVWVNRDIVRHNAVHDGTFDTGELKAGERYAFVTAEIGEVEYRCTIHSRMRGSFRVVERR